MQLILEGRSQNSGPRLPALLYPPKTRLECPNILQISSEKVSNLSLIFAVLMFTAADAATCFVSS